MITSTPVNSSSLTVPYPVFYSSTTGASGGTGQDMAVTTLILCNTGSVTLSDETINSVNVSIYLVKGGESAATKHLVVNNLTIPAGETFFFSEERIILNGIDGGNKDFVAVGATSGGTENAGSFTVGANYTILSTGSTNFVAIGAADNNPGTHFTATGIGSGTGTAIRNLISCTVSSLPV